jgi:SAM-dependent methyltransferase
MPIKTCNVVEMERSANLTELLKETLGGLLPGLADPVYDVLSIGSLTWALEMARTGCRWVTGVDTSIEAIARANREARDSQQGNVDFTLEDALSGPFDFPDASFDLIRAQDLHLVLLRKDWSDFLREGARLLRPGGKLCLVEILPPRTNAAALETLIDLFLSMMWRAARSFSPTDRGLGLRGELPALLISAGFHETRLLDHTVDLSAQKEWSRDYLIHSRGCIQPFLKAEAGVQEYIERLDMQQQREMERPHFHGELSILTVWATKCEAVIRETVSGLMEEPDLALASQVEMVSV